MTISSATIQTKIEAAVTAQENGDYATAISLLRSAKMLLAGLPQIQTGDAQIAWDRASIDSMIESLEKEQTAADAAATGGPFKTTDMIYKRG